MHTPPQDRIERLADRVLSVAKLIAGHGNGRTFTVDAIYDQMPEINRQRISDAIKTLKDARRIHSIGRSKGIYEIEEFFPPMRQISVSTMTDGWRLVEIGEHSIAVTPAEASELGSYLAGDAVRSSLLERFKAMESALAEVQHQNYQLRQRLRGMTKAAVQGVLALDLSAT